MLRRRIAMVAIGAAVAAPPVAAQELQVHVRRPPPAPAASVLESALSRPYVVRYERFNTRLFRDSVFATSVVVVGSDATVASTVHGDVLVVNGNLFLRPGARIDGNAIAFGGTVYDARGATVAGERETFRALRFGVDTTDAGLELSYVPPPPPEGSGIISLPAAFGFRVPAYDRVEGASIPWGPHLSLIGGHIGIDPTATYRSALGEVDAAATLEAIAGRWSLVGVGERATLSNDGWILPDLDNSASALFGGRDYRNYWRADRFEGRLQYDVIGTAGMLTLSAGARTERDWSAAATRPWSLFGRDVGNGMIRPNPAIDHGRVTSALAEARAGYLIGDVKLDATVRVERAFDTPSDERFTQTTADLAVSFPTFASQHFALRSHAVLTSGDSTPPQRFAYLGGSQTLPVLDVLSLGGDRLLFIASSYSIPITALRVKLLGAPTVTLEHAIGSAGLGRLPRFDQDLGARLSFTFVWVSYDVDPNTHRGVFLGGATLPSP